MKKLKIDKKVLYLLSIFIILFIGYGIYLFYEGRMNADKKEIISEKLLSDKTYDDLLYTNIKINDFDGVYSFAAMIENKGQTNHIEESVNIVFLDKKGKRICSVGTQIQTLSVNAVTGINIPIEEKCKKAYTFVIEKKEEGNNEYE